MSIISTNTCNIIINTLIGESYEVECNVTQDIIQQLFPYASDILKIPEECITLYKIEDKDDTYLAIADDSENRLDIYHYDEYHIPFIYEEYPIVCNDDDEYDDEYDMYTITFYPLDLCMDIVYNKTKKTFANLDEFRLEYGTGRNYEQRQYYPIKNTYTISDGTIINETQWFSSLSQCILKTIKKQYTQTYIDQLDVKWNMFLNLNKLKELKIK